MSALYSGYSSIYDGVGCETLSTGIPLLTPPSGPPSSSRTCDGCCGHSTMENDQDGTQVSVKNNKCFFCTHWCNKHSLIRCAVCNALVIEEAVGNHDLCRRCVQDLYTRWDIPDEENPFEVLDERDDDFADWKRQRLWSPEDEVKEEMIFEMAE